MNRPISGTASDVGGIVSATRSRKTVSDNRTVTPTNAALYTVQTLHTSTFTACYFKAI